MPRVSRNPWEAASAAYQAAQTAVEATKKGSPFKQLFELSEGGNVLRILPRVNQPEGEGPFIWYYSYSKLPILPIPQDGKAVYAKCYQYGYYESVVGTCPIFERLAALNDEGFDVSKLAAYFAAYMNVIVYRTQEADMSDIVVKPFRVYTNVFDQIGDICKSHGDISDVERGRSLSISVKKRSNYGSDFHVIPNDPEPLGTTPTEVQDILRRRFSLEAFAPMPGDEELQKVEQYADGVEAFVRALPERFAPGNQWRGDLMSNLPAHILNMRKTAGYKLRSAAPEETAPAPAQTRRQAPVQPEPEDDLSLLDEAAGEEAEPEVTGPIALEVIRDGFKADKAYQPPCFGQYTATHRSCKFCPKTSKCRATAGG